MHLERLEESITSWSFQHKLKNSKTQYTIFPFVLPLLIALIEITSFFKKDSWTCFAAVRQIAVQQLAAGKHCRSSHKTQDSKSPPAWTSMFRLSKKEIKDKNNFAHIIPVFRIALGSFSCLRFKYPLQWSTKSMKSWLVLRFCGQSEHVTKKCKFSFSSLSKTLIPI